MVLRLFCTGEVLLICESAIGLQFPTSFGLKECIDVFSQSCKKWLATKLKMEGLTCLGQSITWCDIQEALSVQDNSCEPSACGCD